MIGLMDSLGRVYQKGDGKGFVWGEKYYEGFPDIVELPLELRKQVARWAVARSMATDEQHRLAAIPLVGPSN